jgi:transposase
MEPRLAEAEAGTRAVYYVDASHFVFGAFLGYVWCAVRRWVRAPAGRQRWNVLGALNAVTKKLLVVSNAGSINAQSVCDLLVQLRRAHRNQSISVFLDNARYQRARLVRDKAEELNIELLYLPPYSPNLNLIERFWKFVKRRCLYSRYYETFEHFHTTIDAFVRTADREHKTELKSLLTPNFQSFEEAQFLTV